MDLAGKPKRYLLKFFKVLAWVVLSIILLLITISLIIQIPAVQNKIVQEAVGYLKEKIKTEVRLRHVSLSFPKRLVLDGLYVEDQSKDTLLYVGRLGVDTDLWGLLRNKIELNDVQLDTVTAKIRRSGSEKEFNFNYIVQAFAPDTIESAPKDTLSEPWIFSLESVGLTQARASFHDALNGTEIDGTIGETEISMDEFNINDLIFKIDEVSISETIVRYSQNRKDTQATISNTAKSTSESPPVQLGFSQVELENIKFDYNDFTSRQIIHTDLSKASVDIDEFDLNEQVIKIDEFTLENTFFTYHQMFVDSTLHPSTDKQEKSDSTSKPWLITAASIELTENTFQYYNFNHPAKNSGIDFNRLWISKINLEAEDLRFHDVNDLAANIEEFQFFDKSGFSINSLQAKIALANEWFEVSDFNLNSGNSSIHLNADGEFPSFNDLENTYPEASINLEVNPSFIALKDILFFDPTLLDSIPLNLPENSQVKFNAACHGKINDLTIDHITIDALSETSLEANGKVKGFPDAKNSVLNAELKKFHTSHKDARSILPDSVMPKSITLPDQIDISGTLKGSLNAPLVETLIKTDFGSVTANIEMNFDSTAAQNYDGHLAIQQFELGKLLNQDTTIGKLDLQASVRGRGFKMEDIDAIVDLTVNEFDYNNYSYKNFKIDGSLKKYFFSGNAGIDDKNIDLKITGDLDYNENVPVYKFTLDLVNADFQALHLSERPLRMRGKLDVNLATADFRVLNGNVNIRKVAVFNGEKLYAVDSLLFASIDQRGESEIRINSDILSGEFKGNINLFTLPEAIKRHINTYFSFRDSTYNKPVDPQNFEFNLVIKNTELITEIIFPELEPFIPGEISGEFDSEEKRLRLTVNLSKINYSGIMLDSVWLKVISDPNSFDYTFALEKVRVDTLRIEELKLSGNIMNDSIYTIFAVLDSLKKDKYVLGGVFNSYEDAFQFRFLQKLLMLNYEKWSTPYYNTLRFTDKGLVPNNFYITKNDDRILLIKKENQDSTLTLAFSSVDLKDITSVVEGVTPIGGIIDGDLTIGVSSNGSFTSELSIKELKILEQIWGDLTIKLDKSRVRPITVDVSIQGENVVLKTDGSFLPGNSDTEVHLTTTLSKLNLAAIEPLTKTWVKGLKGHLEGNLKVDGYTSAPSINGELKFRDAEVTPSSTGGKFIIKDETIKLTGSGLVLNDFKVSDASGNIARFDGSIQTKTFTTFDVSLTFDAKNFQVMNTTEDDNDLFYGNVSINAHARITGSSDLPKVNVNASLSEGSNFTYIVPESEKAILEQEGIVKFIDRDAVIDPFLASVKPADTVTKSFRAMDLTANITLNDKAIFNIIIDPITGDKLSVQGNSTLTLDIDETGDMQLSGRYEISEGTYDMSFYKLVKRQFNIEKGGTITWTGEVLRPEMDIRAMYRVETSPAELLTSQSATADPNAYKERLPFLVFLILKGDMLTPDISFQLDMPPEKQNVYGGVLHAKLKDINTRESELNKQVFALLVLKRFISDNPFESQDGNYVAATARTSVSRLLTEQLNRLGENIKGVKLTFDVKSYDAYSSGTGENATQLQLGLSKTLLNDRLVVKISSNVDVEGEAASEQDSFTDYVGDIALEYKLTEDGRLRITGFRYSNYDMIDGELIETGVGLIYIKDYDAFRELFKRNAEE